MVDAKNEFETGFAFQKASFFSALEAGDGS